LLGTPWPEAGKAKGRTTVARGTGEELGKEQGNNICWAEKEKQNLGEDVKKKQGASYELPRIDGDGAETGERLV
jgi:hypothetical protein